MFNTRISKLETFPATMKQKIMVQENVLDDSLFMTATILLYNRVNNLKLTSNLRGDKDVENISLNPDVYSFYWFENVSTNPDELLKPVRKNFKSIEKLPTHEKFLSEQLKTPVFIRLMPEENTVCIFSQSFNLSAWHCIQFFIPKYFKIFKEKPLTKDEISFLETLTFKMSGNYISKLTEMTNTNEFNSFKLKDQLEAFEKKLFEKKVAAAKNRLDSLLKTMEEVMEAYQKACEQRIEAIALVDGLENMSKKIDEHTELQDYLINNPRICNITLDGSNISFIVKTYLAPHHIDDWEVISKSNRVFDSYAANAPHPYNNKNNVKLLLDALFSEDRCLKLKMCGYFKMDYFGSKVTSQSRYPYTTTNPSLKDYIPNPHLNYHNCMLENKTAITTQLTNGDAIGAIECAMVCAQRINIHESMTFDPFVRELLNSTGKCIVSDDSKEMTVIEALDYLKGNNNE